jgi:hypothetical protein
MKKDNSNGFTAAGLFIMIGLVALGWFIYTSARYVKLRDRVVNVKGLSEREVKANIAIWPITFKQASNDLGTLYNDMEDKQKMLIDFLKRSGFSKDEITAGQFVTTDRVADAYSSQNIKFRYVSKNTVTVYSEKVELLREVMNGIGELGKKGIAIEPPNYENRTEFLFTKLNEIKPEMVEEATAKAREVADKFARDSKSELGKLKSARQGQFSIFNRDSNTPHIKKVRVVTTLEYYLVD